jgi:cytochrome o ubiquinol oxidase operon protein cyoD
MSHNSLRIRLIGFAISLILTFVAILIVFRPSFFSLNMQMNILFLFVLAILQFMTQSVCFLNVLSEKGPRWNLLIFLSTISIALVIVIFTIWVMHHLNYRMM